MSEKPRELELFPIAQIAALSARSPRCGLIAPKDITEIAKNAGHDAVVCADRHYAAQIPSLIEAARAQTMPIVIGLWIDIAQAGAIREHKGPPEGPPGDVMIWAKNERGIEAIAEISSEVLTREPEGIIERAALERWDCNDIGIAAANIETIDVLEGRTETIGAIPGWNKPVHEHRHCSEAALRSRAEKEGKPVFALWPWIARNEGEREAAAVLGASAKGSTVEARRKSLPEKIAIMDRATLIANTNPEMMANSGALIETALGWSTPRKGRFARKGSTPETDQKTLEERAWIGLEQKLGKKPDETYAARLREELEVIEETSFAGLFLAVQEILEWSRKQGALTGPARGSSAASLVAWAVDINAPDPIREKLLFERFLSKGRSVAPDFDLDFEPRVRAQAQVKMMELWGEERSARICSWATFEEKQSAGKNESVHGKQAIRSSLRAYGVPPPTADILIEQWVNGEEPGKGRDKARFEAALANADALKDATNAVSRHASAIVLAPSPIQGRLAVCRDTSEEDSLVAVQADHREAEAYTGCAKADCLSIDALTVIRQARTDGGITGDPWSHEKEIGDDEAYARLTNGETTGVFQLEGEGITRAAGSLGIDSYDDLRALVAMYRPGPIDQIEPMGKRKRGEEEGGAPHPVLEELLNETHGIIVYQEQAIRAAQIMAGFSTQEADQLRRGISKKKKEDLDKLKAAFTEGTKKTHENMGEQEIRTVWTAIERQAGYAFNRAHATGYAMISRATARLRQQAPGPFLAALVDVAAQAGKRKDEKLARIAIAAATEGIKLIPPDPSRPTRRSIAEEDENLGKVIRCGLGVIAGVGRQTEMKWSEKQADPRRKNPEIAEKWLKETVGMNPKAIEEILSVQGMERWPTETPEQLPRREDRDSITTRGNLKPLSYGRSETSNERFKTLTIIEAVDERWVTLNDGDARIRAVRERRRNRSGRTITEGKAVIALLMQGSPPKFEGSMPWREADEQWAEAIRVEIDETAAAERAQALKKTLEAYKPGSGQVMLRARINGAMVDLKTDLKIAIREGMDEAVLTALEPHTEGCSVKILRRAIRHQETSKA